MLDGEVTIGRKLFEEIDKPTDSKIILENKEEGVTEKVVGPEILKDIISFRQEKQSARDTHTSTIIMELSYHIGKVNLGQRIRKNNI